MLGGGYHGVLMASVFEPLTLNKCAEKLECHVGMLVQVSFSKYQARQLVF